MRDLLVCILHELSLVVAVSIWATSIVLSGLLVVSALTLPVFYPSTPAIIYLFAVVSFYTTV